MSRIAQTTNDSILGVIRKESWILDHFEIFVTIAFNAKPKMMLPPSEQHCLGRGVRALTAF